MGGNEQPERVILSLYYSPFLYYATCTSFSSCSPSPLPPVIYYVSKTKNHLLLDAKDVENEERGWCLFRFFPLISLTGKMYYFFVGVSSFCSFFYESCMPAIHSNYTIEKSFPIKVMKI